MGGRRDGKEHAGPRRGIGKKCTHAHASNFTRGTVAGVQRVRSSCVGWVHAGKGRGGCTCSTRVRSPREAPRIGHPLAPALAQAASLASWLCLLRNGRQAAAICGAAVLLAGHRGRASQLGGRPGAAVRPLARHLRSRRGGITLLSGAACGASSRCSCTAPEGAQQAPAQAARKGQGQRGGAHHERTRCCVGGDGNASGDGPAPCTWGYPHTYPGQQRGAVRDLSSPFAAHAVELLELETHGPRMAGSPLPLPSQIKRNRPQPHSHTAAQPQHGTHP